MPTGSARALVERWEEQQAAYITRREERFAVVLDIVAAAVPEDGLVLDLACGPGSISTRVLERFPRVRCVSVDRDPALLLLAERAASESGTAHRIRFVDVDLAEPRWPEALDGNRPDAVLTSTALHWLPAPALVELYSALGRLLPAEGVFVNADHLRADTGRRLFTALAAADDAATQRAAWARGADTWEQWFARLSADPTYQVAMAERARRFAGRSVNHDLSAAFHLEALRAAGFAEVGTVWQHLDDYVLLARR